MMSLAPITRLGVLSLAGGDSKRFLHGQCTQEVKAKSPGEGGYAFLLDSRGRNLGDFRFLVREEDILCFVDRGRVEATRAWLDKFVIAADVRIADVSDRWSGLWVLGEGSEKELREILGADPPALEDRAVSARVLDRDFLVVGDHGFGAPGFDVWAQGDGGPSALAALAARLGGGASLDAGALESLRIEAGRPRFGVDVDETTLPGETGQEERAVSYTKGCYSGQEVVAKQKYLGKPRRMLMRVVPAHPIATPAPLFVGDAEVGRLTSCAISRRTGAPVGLAMIKSPLPEPGAVLSARIGGETTAVAVAAGVSSPSSSS